jgi:2,4-dienoyl-CoA reductase-like NADH-dependent reductase (Old Yellow Enzyme family)
VVALGRAAILDPDWPIKVRAGAEPDRPPMTRADLEARAVSPTFAGYLTRWKGLVAD